MHIKVKDASWYDTNRCEWNGSENDTYDVVEGGRVIRNFKDWSAANDFIKSQGEQSILDRFRD